MKKCKYCKSEIASDAKNCPNCGKKQGMPVLVIVLIVFGVLIVLASLGASNDSNKVKEKDSSNSSTNQTEEQKETSKQSKFEYDVTNQYHDTFAYYIEGTVKNNTSREYSYFAIEFICYDASGNNLGTAIDNTNSFLAGDTWKYKAMFMGSNSDEVDHCDYHEMTKW